jgi:mono/diheme cytochrome c family protein
MHDRDGSTGEQSIRRRARSGVPWLGPLALVAALFVLGPALAQAGPSDDTLRLGADVYQSVCSSCHQPGGVGLSGQYPPLAGNPHVDDAQYVETVIRNGREGEIVVDGTTYDGVMPAQSTLSDDEIAAVIAYVQSGFAAPAGAAPAVEAGPVAGTDLPPLSTWAIGAAVLIAVGAGLLVLGPRIVGAHDRRTMPWLDAWLKTGVIVVGMIVATTIVPARVLEIQAVRDLSRNAQDLIAVGLWLGGLGAGLWALWYAHRERRI